MLGTVEDGFGYANLAIRGRKLRQVVDEQLGPALALLPDLVTVYAGGNDILRPSVDIDAMMAPYDDGVARRLVSTNWLRTAAWTAGTVCAAALVLQAA